MFQDTAGQERFHALGPIYYRDSQGAILVYDITDEDSFEKVDHILVVVGSYLLPHFDIKQSILVLHDFIFPCSMVSHNAT